ncbi:hypothetical protein Tco_1562929 [Tanacetum coccineum]
MLIDHWSQDPPKSGKSVMLMTIKELKASVAQQAEAEAFYRLRVIFRQPENEEGSQLARRSKNEGLYWDNLSVLGHPDTCLAVI